MLTSCPLLPLLIGIALCPAATYGQAPALPNKPVRIIIPNAAGGPADLVGRLIAPKLSETLGNNVVVDNRPSPNGVISSEYVARATADGSILGVGNTGTHAINATLYVNPTYHPVRDFAPVTEVMVGSLVVLTHPAVPARSIKDLIAEARRAPGKLNIAIAGATAEIAGNMIKMAGTVEMNNVPYKGSAPAMIAVVSNEAQVILTMYFAGLGSSIDAGKLNTIGVTGSRRIPQLSNVPTLAESGLDGYEVEFWTGIFAPAKTPAATVQALNREIARIIHLPEVKPRFLSIADEVVGSTPEQFSERVRRDTEKYRKIILESKMQRLE